MGIAHINQDDPLYPRGLQQHMGDEAPEQFTALGNFDLLQRPILALFCSRKCPGSLILQTHDLAQALRKAEVTVIGGFHTPGERECLTTLLRGFGPVIICPARSLPRRIPAEWRKPLDDGRLLLLSPFDEKQRRMTHQFACQRNRFVAAMADTIFVAHAAPGGRTEQLCEEVVAWGTPVYTHEHEACANLSALGAKTMGLTDVGRLI